VHALEGGTGREQGSSERRDGGDAGVEDVVTSVVLGGKDATIGIGSKMGFCMLADTRLVHMENNFPRVKA
jgi:hypothetical protein